MRSKKPLSTLKNKADKVFSLYIRQREADHRGWTSCCTCGRTMDWKEIQCGHFQSRRYNQLRWDERNAHSQCAKCNLWGSGEQFKMGRHIDLKYGQGTAEELERIASEPFKLTRDFLEKIIIEYTIKLERLNGREADTETEGIF